MTGLLASEAIGRRVGGGRAVVAVPVAAAVDRRAARPALAVERRGDVGHAVDRAGHGGRLGRLPLRPDRSHALAPPGGRGGRGRHRHALGLWPRRGADRRGRAPRRPDGLAIRPTPRAIRDARRRRASSGRSSSPRSPCRWVSPSSAARPVPFAADFGAYRVGPAERPPDLVHDERRPAHLRDDERGVLPRPGRRAVLVRAARPSRDLGRGLGRATRRPRGLGPARSAGRPSCWPSSPGRRTRTRGSSSPRCRPSRSSSALGTWRLAPDGRRPAAARPAGTPGGPARGRRRAPGSSSRSSWPARFTASFIDRQTADLAAIRRLEAEVPSGARLIAHGPDRRLRPRRRPGRRGAVRPRSGDGGRPPGRRPAELPGHRPGRDRRPMGRASPGRHRRRDPGRPRARPRIDDAGTWTLYRIGSP